MSGQRSLRGRGGCYGGSGACGFTAAAATLKPRWGGASGPSQRRRTGHHSGWERRWELPRAPGLPSSPVVLGSPVRPTSSAPLPLLPPAPPSPKAEWCGPPPADRPGIPARSPGLAPARAPAPSPSPRPETPDAAAASSSSSFERGPGPAAATAAAAELRRRRRAPWEMPGASAAKRPVCRLAVPAASGGKCLAGWGRGPGRGRRGCPGRPRGPGRPEPWGLGPGWACGEGARGGELGVGREGPAWGSLPPSGTRLPEARAERGRPGYW